MAQVEDASITVAVYQRFAIQISEIHPLPLTRNEINAGLLIEIHFTAGDVLAKFHRDTFLARLSNQ